MSKLTRRDFLKLTGAALAATAFGALPPEDEPRAPIGLGRVMTWGVAIRDAPTLSGKVMGYKTAEDIVEIYGTGIDPDETRYNRIWYAVAGGYIYSGVVQPVANVIQAIPPLNSLTNLPALGEITVPYTYARFGPEDRGGWAYTLYYGTTYWVYDLLLGRDGLIWYKILDDKKLYFYSVRAAHMRLIPPVELAQISPGVTNKRVEINIKTQELTGYEGETEVMKTRVATGYGGFGTPRGEWKIRRKRPSRHMSADDGAAADNFDLFGVPWVSYFYGGMSFHGTYWHNDFGAPRSHGCVNMTPQAAKWLYRWSDPVVEVGKMQSPVSDDGTPVIVF
ncbi:MAG: L,D-transpeptidase [Chloroflexi bacterium]|nr:L,D-transpeptidase [Chloroflexota bacterium]